MNMYVLIAFMVIGLVINIALAIAKKLHERNYFITASYIGEDCLYPCDTEEEDMQQFLLYYREPK